MKSNDQLKEIDIKNLRCYYSDDMIRTEHFYINNILVDEITLYQNQNHTKIF